MAPKEAASHLASNNEEAATNGTTPKPEEQNAEEAKKPGVLKRVWQKAGLDIPTILMMFKGALPPMIAIAAYEADAWAKTYTTLGYLVAIMALLSMAIQPRAKFLQSMLTSVVFTCTGAAVALLQIQCAVAARQSTSPAAQPTAPGSSGSSQAVQYNAAASTVAAIWLFVAIYIANIGRACRPQLMLPIIQYSIFAMVSSTFAPGFPNMTAGQNFVRRLLITFLTGFGIATGVSLVVFPMTSRMIAAKQMAGLLGLMKGSLAAHAAYLESITQASSAKIAKEPSNQDSKADKSRKKGKNQLTGPAAKAKASKENLVALAALFGKLRLELGFAKKEIAYGKLCPDVYSALFTHFLEVLSPLMGMTTFIDILQSVKNHKNERENLINSDETAEAIAQLEQEEWDEIMGLSHGPFVKLNAALMGGLTHCAIVLELAPKPKVPKGDVEKDATASPVPGNPGFTEYLQAELESFHRHREGALQRWCEKKGVEVPTSFWDDPSAQYPWKDTLSMTESVRQSSNQQQLYLILYMEYLIYAIGKSILGLARYADSKVEDGTMKKKRLIFPGWRRLRKLFEGNFRRGDSEQAIADGENTGNSIWVGDSLKTRKDPEHLPPSTAYQKITNKLRSIPEFLSSQESAFAFRAAVASLSLGVLAFLRQTNVFFLQQRGVWALIMTAISMDSHAGRGVFGFAARILGTAIAMVASMVIWYIGDKKPAAIIPVFFLYLMCGIWFLMKNPNLAIVAVISMVTAVLIVGYELISLKLGVALVEKNGQVFYDIYILGPYRLATVCAGLAVAFFWTYFPYPVTTHSTLRKDLGQTLHLMANFYSCVHTTVDTKLRYGSKMASTTKGAPMYKLDKARRKCFRKIILMLGKLREHSNFTKFEPTLGGKFPKETYDELITCMQHLFNYISLIAYSSDAFVTEREAEESGWLRDFRKFTSDLRITSHEMTTTLCLVSASVTNSQPLPPYLQPPRPFLVADRMEAVDPGILSIKHVHEPCYAAFAVLEVASSLITEEMAFLVKRVTDLVGEVDFSFHVISTSSDSSSMASTLFDETDKGDKGKKD